MKLHQIAHSRAGDKGTISNISVIAFKAEYWPLIERQITAERIAEIFGAHRVQVTRFELPQLNALNFVIRGALEGGVTRSLALDPHGKALSFSLLDLEIDPEGRAFQSR